MYPCHLSHVACRMPGSGGFANPETIIANLNVQAGFKVADFGCGSGYFTILLAKAVGENGLVTAIDVLETALGTVKSKAQAEGLFNISYIRANLEVTGGSKLDDNSQDMVLLANILFQSQQKEDIVKESGRVLKPQGELVVIDWLPDSAFGPAEAGWKLGPDQAKALVTPLGFEFRRDLAVSDKHWGIVFKKI